MAWRTAESPRPRACGDPWRANKYAIGINVLQPPSRLLSLTRGIGAMGPRVREDEVTLVAQGPSTTAWNAGTHGQSAQLLHSMGPRVRRGRGGPAPEILNFAGPAVAILGRSTRRFRHRVAVYTNKLSVRHPRKRGSGQCGLSAAPRCPRALIRNRACIVADPRNWLARPDPLLNAHRHIQD